MTSKREEERETTCISPLEMNNMVMVMRGCCYYVAASRYPCYEVMRSTTVTSLKVVHPMGCTRVGYMTSNMTIMSSMREVKRGYHLHYQYKGIYLHVVPPPVHRYAMNNTLVVL